MPFLFSSPSVIYRIAEPSLSQLAVELFSHSVPLVSLQSVGRANTDSSIYDIAAGFESEDTEWENDTGSFLRTI